MTVQNLSAKANFQTNFLAAALAAIIKSLEGQELAQRQVQNSLSYPTSIKNCRTIYTLEFMLEVLTDYYQLNSMLYGHHHDHLQNVINELRPYKLLKTRVPQLYRTQNTRNKDHNKHCKRALEIEFNGSNLQKKVQKWT